MEGPVFDLFRKQELTNKSLNYIEKLSEIFLEVKDAQLAEEGTILPNWVTELICSIVGKQGNNLGNEISRCFGIEETRGLIRIGGGSKTSINFHRQNSKDSVQIDHRLTIGTTERTLESTIPEGIQFRVETADDDYQFEQLHHFAMNIFRHGGRGEEQQLVYAWMLLSELINSVLYQIVGPLELPAYYLPADRTGIMHAHSVVEALRFRVQH